ncbi:hypothetical protein NQ315_002651 [Exocentrus adspersus]|uniref:Uncharacterized protein n=1 Tax=Exocentrus adspersus TaxID=1586481 RepID=A0AAV8VU75_9CUCU|nr:hypothetical protein NQ315_002651 [Exocentrus adspersus]
MFEPPQVLSSSTSENRLSLNLSGPNEFLPRIAEEKDSPTNSQEGKEKCDKSLGLSKAKALQENPKQETAIGIEGPSTDLANPQITKSCDKSWSEVEKNKKENSGKVLQKNNNRPAIGQTTTNTSKVKLELKSKESKNEDKISSKPPPK